MSDHLELILEDLKVGLRRRAERRRRTRTGAATAMTTAALAAIAVSWAGLLAETGPTASASSGGAAAVITRTCDSGPACWSALNVSKPRQN